MWSIGIQRSGVPSRKFVPSPCAHSNTGSDPITTKPGILMQWSNLSNRASEILCIEPVETIDLESIAEHRRELSFGCGPLAWEMTAAAHRAAQLCVQTFNGVGRIDHFSHLLG